MGARTAPLIRAWMALAAAVVLLLTVAVAQPARADGRARLDVRIIHATKGDPYVHPSLQDLAQHFRRFGGYERFTLLGRQSMELAMEQTGTMALPNGKSLQLIYRGTSKEYVKLRFIMGDLQMNIRVHEGGVFFHGGTQYGGGALVIAVKATSG